jgi:TolA-binding protein
MRKQVVIGVLTLVMTEFALAATPQKLSQFPEGERLVYGKLVQAFRKNDMPEVMKQRRLLERHYPASVHLDNAYYLMGMLEFQNSQIGESIRSFNVVTNRFPKSNKRPAALFAKGAAYSRLNLRDQALRAWRSLIDQYPGSPDAERAKMQIRMAKMGTAKS